MAEEHLISFENIDSDIIAKWQGIADLLAKIISVPAALIMKTENEHMEVLVSSKTDNNPYNPGDKEKWHGLYCETVIKTQKELLVPNATTDSHWKNNPDIKLGMIAYLGYPINFPDRTPFGTLCVLDNRENAFSSSYKQLLLQLRDTIETDIALLKKETLRNQAETRLKSIEWMLSPKKLVDPVGQADNQDHYGDLTELNSNGIILNSVGCDNLKNIANDYMELLGTSSAIYEKNGDYALGIFASSWCRMMDCASRKLCNTSDNAEALSSGKWLCHESCWTDCSRIAIAEGKAVDIECSGAIRMYSEPIFADNKVVGSINFGYGDPPKEKAKLQELATSYHLDYDELVKQAHAYESRPPFVIEMAKKRLHGTARLIGSIVEKTLSQEALRENESMLNIAGQMAKIGGWELYPETMEVTWTDETYRIHEVPKNFKPPIEDAINFWHPEDQPILKKAIQQALDNGIPYDLELRFITAKGRNLCARTKCNPILRNGKVIKLQGYFQDITEAKLAEATLEAEKERLAVTLRSIGDGVITTDTNGNIALLNRTAEEMTGWPTTAAVGRPLEEVFNIINEITRKKCENPVAKVLATGEIVELANHTALVTRDNREIIIADSAAPIKNANDETIGVVLVFRDMTEKKKLESAVEVSSKLESLGVLAGGIAHDFNNLLGGIYGFIDMAIESAKDETTSQYLSKTISTIERARALTQQLLTFAKGGAPVQKIAPLFPFVKETAQFALSGSNVSCDFDIQQNMWNCNYDRNQVGQVIDNLIINAQQAMPVGGSINVSARNVSLAEKEHPQLAKGDYV
ncbi:MAG: PAS domain S-box protein, partial [Chitinivibrionales bacterium]|nr:PAS domain S-box protein [Chitinivibrionales bacterium]